MTPTASASDAGARPQRADARRNHARVLEAARAEFADCGPDAQMPDIARRAGVGVGTVYRHFPTKEALVAALARDHFSRMADELERAAAREGDAWEILVEVTRACGKACADDRGLAAAVAGAHDVMIAAADENTRLRGATTTLLERARATGHLRQAATVDDVARIMCSLAHVADLQDARPGFSWERYLQVALDGMRAR